MLEEIVERQLRALVNRAKGFLNALPESENRRHVCSVGDRREDVVHKAEELVEAPDAARFHDAATKVTGELVVGEENVNFHEQSPVSLDRRRRR